MYSPNFNIDNLYELWSDKPTNDNLDLYQPPLNAYSPEYPGSSNLKFNYLIHKSNNVISPVTQIKLNKLNSIKYYGYKSLTPIGLNKTMEQIEYESANLSTLDQTASQTIENESNDQQLPVPREEPEVDLDQSMPNMDDANEEETPGDEFDDGDDLAGNYDGNDLDDDAGFMAEDVEYQNDHSISDDIIGNTSGLSNSAAMRAASAAANATSLAEEDMVLDD